MRKAIKSLAIAATAAVAALSLTACGSEKADTTTTFGELPGKEYSRAMGFVRLAAGNVCVNNYLWIGDGKTMAIDPAGTNPIDIYESIADNKQHFQGLDEPFFQFDKKLHKKATEFERKLTETQHFGSAKLASPNNKDKTDTPARFACDNGDPKNITTPFDSDTPLADFGYYDSKKDTFTIKFEEVKIVELPGNVKKVTEESARSLTSEGKGKVEMTINLKDGKVTTADTKWMDLKDAKEGK